MHPILRKAFQTELEKGKGYLQQRSFSDAYYHFERAHILGQCFVWPHFVSHCYFLKLGILKQDPHEIIGQIIRIIGGTIGSAINKVPVGNTGGSNVSPIASMPIPKDLQVLLNLSK